MQLLKRTNIIHKLLRAPFFKFSNSQHYMNLEEKYGCHNYEPMKVVLEKGKGNH